MNDNNIKSKYDSQCSIAEYVSDKSVYNMCNICRQQMCKTESYYINKKNTDAPILCYKCIDAPKYEKLIKAYVLHFNAPSRLTNCWQYFWNIGKITKHAKIKPV